MAEEKVYWDPENPYGSELIANSLVERGVEIVFTLEGGHTMAALNALNDKGVKIVGTRREDGAVYAALGYAMATGKTGVCILTAGMPTIAGWAITNASWGQIPLVIISGANESFAEGLHVLQEMDQVPFAQASFAKAAYHVTRWDRIPQLLDWAFTQAETGIPGCSFIDIPIDIVATKGKAEDLKKFPCGGHTTARPAGEPKLIKEAVKMLAEAKKPLISVAYLAVASKAADEFKQFVELTMIPVEGCMGLLGENPCNLSSNVAAADADVVLVLGKQSMGLQRPYPGKMIVVYPQAEDFGHCYEVDLSIVGDVKVVLQQMIEEVKKVKFPDAQAWLKELEGRRAGMLGYHLDIVEKNKGKKPIHPAVLTKAVLDYVKEPEFRKKLILSYDGADIMVWWFRFTSSYGIPNDYPGQVVSIMAAQNSLGSVGTGIATCIGAGLGRPDKFIFGTAYGDGSLGYFLIELETMARENIPAVFVVSNNAAWGMVYADQRRIWGRDNAPGAFFQPKIRYDIAAEGLGCAKGEFVEDDADLPAALDRAYKRAVKEKKPVLVNVVTDPNVYTAQYPWWLLPATAAGEPFKDAA
jgi:acetolactate synthase-1/2/3 large subunit